MSTREDLAEVLAAMRKMKDRWFPDGDEAVDDSEEMWEDLLPFLEESIPILEGYLTTSPPAA